MGGFAGRLGPAVGYMWNGVWCVRSYQPSVRNPRTAAQMACREAFKMQVQLAAQMREAVVQGLTQLGRQAHMTSYNLFVSMNQPCFAHVDGSLEVDWEHLQLSAGPVAPVEPGAPEVSADGVLSLAFATPQGARRAKGRDRVYLYVHCPELGEGLLAAPVYRRDKHVSLMLPDDYIGLRLVVYTFVQDETGEGSSTTCAENGMHEPDIEPGNEPTVHSHEDQPVTNPSGKTETPRNGQQKSPLEGA